MTDNNKSKVCSVCGKDTKDNPWNTGQCLKHFQELLQKVRDAGGKVIEF